MIDRPHALHRLARRAAAGCFFLAALTVALVDASPALAERAWDPSYEITAMGGYGFAGDLGFQGVDLSFDDGPSVNLMLGVRLRSDEGQLFVLSYQRQRTKGRIEIAGAGSSKFDIDIGYLQAGSEVDGKINDYIMPFVGVTIGATHFSPQSDADTTWFFSGTAYGGVKLPVHRHFGLRIQGRGMFTLIDDNTSICTGAAGCVKSDDFQSLIQADVTAGFYVAF